MKQLSTAAQGAVMTRTETGLYCALAEESKCAGAVCLFYDDSGEDAGGNNATPSS